MSGDERGFTLIEVIIALALFGLIALAGVTLLGSVVRVQRGTEGRLERLAELQRTTAVLAGDFAAIADAPLAGNATAVDFARRTPDGARPIGYSIKDGALMRTLDRGARQQRVLGGVTAVRFAYYRRDAGWQAFWPPTALLAAQWPAAVAVDITLAGARPRVLRRVVDLPVRAAP